MSKVFFETLDIPEPFINLNINSCDHGEMTGKMLAELEKIYKEVKPDLVMVYGDTNSTLAGALSAVKLHIPIAHVEAGLRSFNKKMPEEVNRIVADHLSDLLFCPTETAVKNLKHEGIIKNVHTVGDVMYDSVLYYSKIAESQVDIIRKLHLRSKKYYLATIHRAENTNDPDKLKTILNTLDNVAKDIHPVIIPLHPNTRVKIESLGLSMRYVQLIEPVSYFDMLILEKEAFSIITDSGGVQKEAYWFGVPCITLREETEWVETVDLGCNILVGTDMERISNAIKNPLKGDFSENVYGDGKAAEKIQSLLLSSF